MNKNVKDLSNTNGTYTKELQDHIQEINTGYATMQTEQFRQLVVSIVNKAKDTPTRRKFLNNLSKQRTKDDILMFTTNAYLRGCGMGTNIYDKFNC